MPSGPTYIPVLHSNDSSEQLSSEEITRRREEQKRKRRQQSGMIDMNHQSEIMQSFEATMK